MMKKSDELVLKNAINEIKNLRGVFGIVQIGSSVYSENYNDIDIIVFFNKFLVPLELESIRLKYKKSKLWIEGASVHYKGFNPGFKVFLKSFSHLKHKNFLFGKNPFAQKSIKLKKTDVAAYVWYHYHICEQYQKGYENALPNSLNAMLSYVDVFPKNKEESLKLFIKKFPSLAKYLPKNADNFLRGTNQGNFKELYLFFENSLNYFT